MVRKCEEMRMNNSELSIAHLLTETSHSVTQKIHYTYSTRRCHPVTVNLVGKRNELLREMKACSTRNGLVPFNALRILL